MSDPTQRRGPDLTVARRYLEGYVEPDAPQESRPTWLPLYAWPTAAILLLFAIVSWAAIPYVTPADLVDPFRQMQALRDMMSYLRERTLILGLFSFGHIALNLAVLMFERTRPLSRRLIDVSSIGIPLLVLFTLFVAPVPPGVQFHP